PAMGDKPVVIWRNLTVGFRSITPRPTVAAGESAGGLAQDAGAGAHPRERIAPPRPRKKIRAVVSAETAQKLNFGKSPNGAPIGPDDFASEGSVMFEVPMPEGRFSMNIQVDAELGGDRNQVVRILISDRADGGSRGIPTRAL